jgi:hypothetical protein
MAEQSNIPNLDGLAELAHRDGVDIKPTLLRVMTDLYVQKPRHTAEEEQHYTELALRLIDAVDAPTRIVVAGKLAAYTAPPASLMQRLQRRDGGSVAPAPSPNRSATAAIAELNELFFTAHAEVRRLILVNLQYASLTPADPIPPTAARATIQQLETAALSHNHTAFAQELERALGVPRELARRLIEDESGEPVVVAARVLAMPADVLQRILLCLNPAIGQSVLRVYELARLYEDIEPRSALRMLAIWRSSQRATQPKPAPPSTERRSATPQPTGHQPQYWHTEERPALPERPQIRWEQHVQARKAENQ